MATIYAKQEGVLNVIGVVALAQDTPYTLRGLVEKLIDDLAAGVLAAPIVGGVSAADIKRAYKSTFIVEGGIFKVTGTLYALTRFANGQDSTTSAEVLTDYTQARMAANGLPIPATDMRLVGVDLNQVVVLASGATGSLAINLGLV